MLILDRVEPGQPVRRIEQVTDRLRELHRVKREHLFFLRNSLRRIRFRLSLLHACTLPRFARVLQRGDVLRDLVEREATVLKTANRLDGALAVGDLASVVLELEFV